MLFINIGHNNIGSSGCKLLAKAGMMSIEYLRLSKYAINKWIVKLKMKDSSIWLSQTGRSYQVYSSVNKYKLY